jgi:hypothetical protein
MNWILRKLDGFWFEHAPASRLAVLRIVIGCFALWYVGKRFRMYMKIARTPDRSLFQPVGLATIHDRPLAPRTFRAVLITTLLLNVAFIVGWRYRYTGPAFASLLLYLMSYRNSWSMIYHSQNGLVLHALVLGFAPAADALSIDALLGTKQRSATGMPPWIASGQRSRRGWQYGWPIQLINTATMLTYFLSGVAKIVGPLGWQWATGEALRSQVAVDGLRKELLGKGAATMAFQVYNHTALFRIMGLGSLLIELSAPLMLVDKRAARLWVLGTYMMHVGILLVMKIRFQYQLSGVMYAPFFDVERIVALIAPDAV